MSFVLLLVFFLQAASGCVSHPESNKLFGLSYSAIGGSQFANWPVRGDVWGCGHLCLASTLALTEGLGLGFRARVEVEIATLNQDILTRCPGSEYIDT